MRTLIISRSGAAPMPPEMMPATLQAFKAWRDKWRSKMEIFEFFASGTGGWGVANTADEKELSQMMLEYPVGAFSSVEVIPTVEGDDALARMGSALEQFMAMMKAA